MHRRPNAVAMWRFKDLFILCFYGALASAVVGRLVHPHSNSVTVPGSEFAGTGHDSPTPSLPEHQFFQYGTAAQTDKVVHLYGHLYDSELPRVVARLPSVKMLEIGLGCNMIYGAGHSVVVWKRYFEHVKLELWMAEYNRTCGEHWANSSVLQDVGLVYGDQADPTTLERWIVDSRAAEKPFDIIVDDGGHSWRQITNSFRALWGSVAPGGLYFIEDLMCGTEKKYQDDKEENNPVTWILDMMQTLMLRENMRPRPPLPMPGLKSIRCATSHCVFEKCGADNDGVSGQPCDFLTSNDAESHPKKSGSWFFG